MFWITTSERCLDPPQSMYAFGRTFVLPIVEGRMDMTGIPHFNTQLRLGLDVRFILSRLA